MAPRRVGSDGPSPAPDWQAAYLAVSALLGEPVDEALLHVDPASRAGAEEVVRELRSSSRHARGRAIARIVSEVVVALDALRLA
ncbi:MAG: hypothetical protein M3O36_15365 [Myxococcota bacterium]|nr:hypothetical protein [Myxococcota bacterium]